MLNRFFEWKNIRGFVTYAVYLLLTLVLQSLLFSRISIFGVKGFIVPAAAVAAGIYFGGVKGAIFSLVLGVLTDIGAPETTVLYTVLFPMIGFGAGLASEFYINKSFFAFMVFSTAAILITGFAQLAGAMIFASAGLMKGMLTVLLQAVLSLLPTALLYLPFRNYKGRIRR